MPPFDVNAARAIRRAACASLAQQGERAANLRRTADRIRAATHHPITEAEAITAARRIMDERNPG